MNDYIEKCAKAAWRVFANRKGSDEDWEKYADREAWTNVARAVLEAARRVTCEPDEEKP